MKKGIFIGGGLAVMAVVAVFFFWSNVGSIIKAAVEKYGSQITQANVTLDEADVSATSGEGMLKGLVVGNPAGFKTDSAFRLGAISLKVDTGTITGNTITINEVVIQAPEVTYEMTGSGDSNLQAIKRNVDTFTKQLGGGSAQPSEGPGKKFIIDNLYVRDGRVSVSAPFLQGKAVGTPLPGLHLKDIGKATNGALAGQVAEQVIDAMTAAAGKAVASIDLADMARQAGVSVEALKGQAGDLLKKATEGGSGAAGVLKEGAAGAGGMLKEGTSGATDAVKGLLGGGK